MAARGRPAGSAVKPWEDALHRAACKLAPDGRRYLDRIAEKTIKMADKGEMSAIAEMGNRLDGKPKQSLEHAGGDGGPIELSISWQASGS